MVACHKWHACSVEEDVWCFTGTLKGANCVGAGAYAAVVHTESTLIDINTGRSICFVSLGALTDESKIIDFTGLRRNAVTCAVEAGIGLNVERIGACASAKGIDHNEVRCASGEKDVQNFGIRGRCEVLVRASNTR